MPKYPILTFLCKAIKADCIRPYEFIDSRLNIQAFFEIDNLIEEIKRGDITEKRRQLLFESLLTLSLLDDNIISLFSKKEVIQAVGYKSFASALINYEQRYQCVFDIFQNMKHFNEKESLYILKKYIEERDVYSIDTLAVFSMGYDENYFLKLFNIINDHAKKMLLYTPIYSLKNMNNILIEKKDDKLFSSICFTAFFNEKNNALLSMFNILSKKNLQKHVNNIVLLCSNNKKHNIISPVNSNYSYYIHSQEFFVFYLIYLALSQESNDLNYFDFVLSKIEPIDKNKVEQYYLHLFHSKDNKHVLEVISIINHHMKPIANFNHLFDKINELSAFNSFDVDLKFDFLTFIDLENRENRKDRFELGIQLLNQIGETNILSEDFKNLFDLNYLN